MSHTVTRTEHADRRHIPRKGVGGDTWGMGTQAD